MRRFPSDDVQFVPNGVQSGYTREMNREKSTMLHFLLGPPGAKHHFYDIRLLYPFRSLWYVGHRLERAHEPNHGSKKEALTARIRQSHQANGDFLKCEILGFRNRFAAQWCSRWFEYPKLSCVN